MAARSRHIVGIKVTQICSTCATPRTIASQCARSQNLLRVIANETGEDRVDPVNITGGCRHKNSIPPCSDEGSKNVSEACVI